MNLDAVKKAPPYADHRVLVYGAAGHTGRFVVDDLVRRGVAPILGGRDAARLRAAAGAARVPDTGVTLEQRPFDLADAGAIRTALTGVDVLVNCAGPFLDTALPLATAAVAAGAHYLDITAEQPAVQALYDALDTSAREAGVAVVPAMAFYGGLADLMTTAALNGSAHTAGGGAEVTVAIGLDHWWPTPGTRATGERNTAVRQVIRDGRLVPTTSPAPTSTWSFPDGLGRQPVVELPFSEAVTIHRHLRVDRLTSYLTTASLAELRDTDTPPPRAADESGRSEQRFVVDVVARGAGEERRVTAAGRDIYAVTAPIVSEGVLRLLAGRYRDVGALAPGAAFDAADVLTALGAGPAGLRIDRDTELTRSGSGG